MPLAKSLIGDDVVWWNRCKNQVDHHASCHLAQAVTMPLGTELVVGGLVSDERLITWNPFAEYDDLHVLTICDDYSSIQAWREVTKATDHPLVGEIVLLTGVLQDFPVGDTKRVSFEIKTINWFEHPPLEVFSRRGNYQEYLKSDQWASIRRRVIRRCDNICEGCGNAAVAQIHHKTYDHRGNEFLFELLGLCDECHARWHGKKINAR